MPLVRVLGIESSCDETAAAVVEDGRRIISNVVHSQIDIHRVYGGVVPEVAARSHLEVVVPVIDRAVKEAGGWERVDAIANTVMPGLIGSLLIGSLTARMLALMKKKPYYPIHHVEAHVYAGFLTEQTPEFPLLALIISGGHSQIVLFHDHGNYELIGQTVDDAVGEAFDKVAKIIGLDYPGGPAVARAALKGDPTRFKFPKARLKGDYDFSFSGLKTAVLRQVQTTAGVDHTYPSTRLAPLLDEQTRCDFAASFQNIACQTLVDKLVKAAKFYTPRTVVVAGGVAANQELRRQLAERLSSPIIFPPINLCTDNAAMVAGLGCFQAERIKSTDPRQLEVTPSISMSRTVWNKK